MPKTRGSRGALKNRAKARTRPKQQRSYPADDHRSEEAKTKRTIDHDLISGFKFSSRSSEAIKSFKSQFITNGNNDPKCPIDRNGKSKRPAEGNDNSQQFIDGADNHKLSAECNHKSKGSVAFEFGNSRKPDHDDTRKQYSMHTEWDTSNFTFVRSPGMPTVANATSITMEPRLRQLVEGNVAKPINGSTQRSWNAQGKTSASNYDRHSTWKAEASSVTATSHRYRA